MQDPFSLDKIRIEDLNVPCLIGIAPKERVNRQVVTVNITLFTEITRAAHSDDIADTINYKKLKDRIKLFMLASRFNLIEKMAHSIAGLCFAEPLVAAVTVKVEKPGALTMARSVSVEISRRRQDYAQ